MSDELGLLARALDQTGAIVARTRPDQAGLPTPCRSWDVRALVDHIVHDLEQFTARAAGRDWAPHDRDLVGDDWAGAYRAAADGLLAAWRASGRAFGPEVPVDDDAPLYARLAGLLGRDPR
jgi:uncharacterized protein (TIGR03086 family)